MEDYVWLTERVNRFEMAWAVFASLLFHALLFFVLSSTSIYLPLTGNVARFDVLWLTPSFSPVEASESESPPADLPLESATGKDKVPQDNVEPDTMEPPVLPADGITTELAALQPDVEKPSVDLIPALVANTKQPSPPRPPTPKETVVIPPGTKPKPERADEAAESPDKPQAKTPEVPQEAEPEPAPLPSEQPTAALAEELRLSELSATKILLAREEADRQRRFSEKSEQDLRAAKAVKVRAEREQMADEAAKEEAEQKRKATEAASLKAEQEWLAKDKEDRERLAETRAQQEKLAHEREQATSEKAERERLSAEAKRRKAEQDRLVKKKNEQMRQERLARERQLAAGKAVRDRQAIETAQKEVERKRLAKEKAAQERMAAERERLAALQQSPPPVTASSVPAGTPVKKQPAVRIAPAPPSLKPSNKETAAIKSLQDGKDPTEPPTKELVSPKPSEKQQAKGLIIPSIHGDLKLIIAGGSKIKLTVLFREYPKSRRNKALTRTEVRREQTILPVIVKTPEQATESIIENAREGIYVFTAEAEDGQPVKAAFTLKIFELSAKGRTKQLGTKTISGKAVIARILMPDAILWEDESAFSGSMEDSNGVTKFNSETGLVWKEYSD